MEPIRWRGKLDGEARRMLDRICVNFDKPLNERPDFLSLNVAVIGGGIGGLAAAISLCQRGHKVTIFESEPRLESIGYGIQIAPNLSRLLSRLGAAPYLEEHYTHPRHLMFRRWQDGRPLGVARLKDFEDTYGSPYLQVNRGDLHAALLRRAIDVGAAVRQNAHITSIDTKKPAMQIEGGPEIRPDLIVVASGVRAEARTEIAGDSYRAEQDVEFAAYRVMVEMEKIKQDPELSWIAEFPHQNAWIGPDHHVMAYPINGNELLNVVTIAPLHGTKDPAEFYDELLREIAGWDPTIERLVRLADGAGKWPIWTAPHLPKLVTESRRAVVIGDAAHDMTPYLGQGAAQAVEDAALLGRVLSCLRTESDLAAAFKIYEAIRIPRTRMLRTEALRTRDRWHMVDGEDQMQRDRDAKAQLVGKDAAVKRHLGALSDPYCQNWLYAFDTERTLLGDLTPPMQTARL